MPWENSFRPTADNELAWADVSNGTLDALPSYEEETETALFIALVTVAVLGSLLAISAAVRYMWLQRKAKPVYLGMDASHTATANSGLTTLSLSNHALDASALEEGSCVTYEPHRTIETDRNRGISIILLHENELIVETQEFMTEIPSEIRDYQEDLKNLLNANLNNDSLTCMIGANEEAKNSPSWMTTPDEVDQAHPDDFPNNNDDIQAETDRLETLLPINHSYETPYPGVGFTQPSSQTDFFSYTNGNQLAYQDGFHGYPIHDLTKTLGPTRTFFKYCPNYNYNMTTSPLSSQPSVEDRTAPPESLSTQEEEEGEEAIPTEIFDDLTPSHHSNETNRRVSSSTSTPCTLPPQPSC